MCAASGEIKWGEREAAHKRGLRKRRWKARLKGVRAGENTRQGMTAANKWPPGRGGGAAGHLVALLLDEAVDVGADDGAEEEGHEELVLGLLVGGEGQREEVRGGVEGGLEEALERDLGHHLLVHGDGQAAVDDVEHALGRALVVLGVVQHALPTEREVTRVGGECGRHAFISTGEAERREQ
jgi:hypothetical protein